MNRDHQSYDQLTGGLEREQNTFSLRTGTTATVDAEKSLMAETASLTRLPNYSADEHREKHNYDSRN